MVEARRNRRARVLADIARLLFAVILALGAWGPTFARLVGGPPVHACHCDVHHTSCACPVCFPEIAEVDTFGHAAVTGRCGDDEHLGRAAVVPATVAEASHEIAPAPEAPPSVLARSPHVPASWRGPPDDEPPRFSS